MKNYYLLLLFIVMGGYAAQAQECTPVNTPYLQDFETATIPALPECTTIVTGGTGAGWVTASSPGNGFENNALVYNATAETADTWYFTKGIQLNAGTFYHIAFKYGNSSTDTTERLQVTFGNAATIAAATNVYTTLPAVTGGTQQQNNTENFAVGVSGVYYFGFHAFSIANQGNLYIDDIIIEEMECGVPSNVMVNNVAQTTANLSWETPTTGNSSSFSVYQYAVTTTNEVPADGIFSPALSVALESLSPSTTYYIFTRTLCGPIWSDWGGPVEFTTASCVATTIPYTQDFESATLPAVPDCTLAVNAGSGNNWVTTNNPGNDFDSNTLQYTANEEEANAWFFTQGIELTAGVFYKISLKYGNNSEDTTEAVNVSMCTSPNPASAFSILNSVGAVSGGTAATLTSPPFMVETTGIYYFGINALSAASQGNLYIDDVEVKEWDCGIAQNIRIDNVTATTATVTWEMPVENTSFGYFVTYSTENVAPATAPYVNALTTELEAMEPGTTYYVFIQSQCGPLMGDWSEGIAFTTAACEAATVPYFLDFEGATVPGIPDCTLEGTATGNTWATAANPGNGFVNNTLQYTGNANAANAWFFTQGVSLTGGTYYRISYKYGNNSPEKTEDINVVFGTSPNALHNSNIAFTSHNGITGSEPAYFSLDTFNVEESGIYYFGFNAVSNALQGNVNVDDFLIEELVCGTPDAVSVTDITATSATVSWGEPVTGNSDTFSVYQYYVSTDNTPPAEGTFEPGFTVNLTDLEPETTYYVFTRTLCGPIWSEWTVTEFTTDEELGLDKVNLKNFRYYPNPANAEVTLDNGTEVITRIELYTLTGQLILQQNVNASKTQVNLEQLSAGAYFLNVYVNEACKKVKVIKQ